MAATCGNGYVFDKLLKRERESPDRSPLVLAVGCLLRSSSDVVNVVIKAILKIIVVILLVRPFQPPRVWG